MEIIANVIREQSVPLLAVCTLAGAYVLISALIIFNVEQNRLILKDGLVAGVLVGYYSVEYILPYMGYVYDSTSDNNGAGYKEREWSKYLICLPFSHTLWN